MKKKFVILSCVMILMLGASVQADLLLHYDFDEGAGGTAASSVNSTADNTLGLLNVGTDTDWAAGVSGGALEIKTGSGGAGATVPTSWAMTGSSNLTLSLWIYRTGTSAANPSLAGALDDQGGTWGHQYMIRANASSNYEGRGFLRDNGNVNTIQTASAEPTAEIPLDTWTHLAITFDTTSATLKFYLNGALIDTAVGTGFTNWNDGSNLDYSGIGNPTGNYSIPGLYDEVRLYDEVLDAAAIEELYNSPGKSPSKAWGPNPEHGEQDVLLDTGLLWNKPTDYVPVKYVLNFRADDPNWLDPINTTTVVDPVVDLNLDGDPDTTEAVVPVTLDYATPYYWRVDSYEPNLVGSQKPILHVGAAWMFTSAPEEPDVTDPISVTEPLGGTATLTVTQTRGTSYKWFKDGVEYSSGSLTEDGDIVLAISPLAIADEALYHCEVYNSVAPEGSPAAAVSAAARVMTERLVGWWKLDGDLSDSVQDEVADAPTHDGSAVTTNFVGSAKNGGGLLFSVDDPNDLVTIADSNDYFNFYPQGYTVSVWVQTTQTSPWGGFVSKQSLDSTRGFVITHNNSGQAVHTLRQSFQDLNSGVQIDDGVEWHLVIGTYDGTTGEGKVYVDGLVANTTTNTSVVDANPSPLVFGAAKSDVSASYDGLLDDIRIWSYPLSAEAVADLYTDFNPGQWVCLNPPAMDTTGPNGEPDCKVDMYEFLQIAEVWLECGRYPDTLCN